MNDFARLLIVVAVVAIVAAIVIVVLRQRLSPKQGTTLHLEVDVFYHIWEMSWPSDVNPHHSVISLAPMIVDMELPLQEKLSIDTGPGRAQLKHEVNKLIRAKIAATPNTELDCDLDTIWDLGDLSVSQDGMRAITVRPADSPAPRPDDIPPVTDFAGIRLGLLFQDNARDWVNNNEDGAPFFPIGSEVSIGRAADNDLRVPDSDDFAMVGNHHCRIKISDDDTSPVLSITDLDSRNGTYVRRSLDHLGEPLGPENKLRPNVPRHIGLNADNQAFIALDQYGSVTIMVLLAT